MSEHARSNYTGKSNFRQCDQKAYHRNLGWGHYRMWCYDAKYSDFDEPVMVRLNRDDFNEQEAAEHTELYAKAIGRIPHILRRDVKYITIHGGNYAFGGGGKDLLIHTGSSKMGYEDHDNWWGYILEEVFVHEAAHTSIDNYVYRTDEWN